jgi:hypothetical protein
MRPQRPRSYGLVGAFIFRIVATLLALYLDKARPGEAPRRPVFAVFDVPTSRKRAGSEAEEASKSEAGVRPPPSGRLSCASSWSTGVFHRFDSGGRRHVAETWVVLVGGILGIVATGRGRSCYE